MKKEHGRFSASLASLFFLVLWLAPYEVFAQERWSREWEARIELSQPSERIMDAIGIKPGMTVAEIGAGNGRLAVRLAGRVGESGRVYANDIDQKALEFMRERVQEEKIKNLIVVEGKETDPQLPPAVMDVIILANTLHMVKEPIPLLKNIIASLKTGGILALIEADREKLQAQQSHPMADMVLPKAAYLKWLGEAGYELVGEQDFLSRHFIMILRARKRFVDNRGSHVGYFLSD